jgi:hypothetical protein
MCGNRVKGDVWGRGRGQKRLVGKYMSIYSKGLVWREVGIFAQRTTTPSKAFFIFTLLPHNNIQNGGARVTKIL